MPGPPTSRGYPTVLGTDSPAGATQLTALANAVNNDMAGRAADIVVLQGADLGPGEVRDWAGAGDPAGGRWLLCDGRQLSRTTYATLFTRLGTTYGAGNGTTTFNIPDCRGRVNVGPDNMGTGAAGRLPNTANTRGSAAGEERHTLSSTEMPAHNHNGSVGRVSTSLGSPNGSLALMGDVTSSVQDSQILTIASNGGSGPHNNIQPSLMMNKVIRVL